MPSLFAHIQLVKDLIEENPKLFAHSDLKYLSQGAIFPDIHFITDVRTLTNKPNFSTFILEHDIEYIYGKSLLDNAQNKQERLFALGVISHLILDKHVHNYFKEKGFYNNVLHVVSEYYLETKFPNYKIPLPKFPLKLVKICFKKTYPKYYDTYKNRIKVSIAGIVFFQFANRFIITRIINARYRKDNYKKRLALYEIPFKLAKSEKYKKMGYDFTPFLNPDTKVRDEHLDNMMKCYKYAKKEFTDFVMDYELNVPDYTTKQTEIRDFI
ncbi:MAG: zinc dependent phospholipase C family protein [archaeon]|jgi:hypothetical protein